jgi:competence protein CoiA
MLVGSCQLSDRILARDAEKNMAPFTCPDCSKEVILHKGLIRVHHFQHKPPVNCIYGSGETDVHYSAKLAIYDSIRSKGTASAIELECRLMPGVRPDVYFEMGTAKVALEIQKTAQTVEEMKKRTLAYAELGVHVIWILPEHAPQWTNEKGNVCRVQIWHEFLHTTYFGRVYYWQHDRFVRAAHFDKCFREIPEGNWVEDWEENIGDDLSETYFYQEEHDNAYYGGGRRLLKTHKEVVWYPSELDLLADFRATSRSQLNCKRYDVPACRLWMDSRKHWWPKEDLKANVLGTDF